jgi:Protein of unknown function (DUF3102)
MPLQRPETEVVKAASVLDIDAQAIRALGKNVVRDIIEIGRHLTEAKQACAHGQWLPWHVRSHRRQARGSRLISRAMCLTVTVTP